MSVFQDPERLGKALKRLGCTRVQKELDLLTQSSDDEPEIPSFYMGNSSLMSVINTLASKQSISKLAKNYPSEEDIQQFKSEYTQMKSRSAFPSLYGAGKQVKYTEYVQLREKLPEDIQPFLSTKLFIQLRDPNSNSVCSFNRLVQYLQDISECVAHYTEIMNMDESRSGLITTKDFTKYVRKFVERIPWAEERGPAFLDRYAIFVTGSILTRLDPLRTGRLSVSVLLSNPIFMHWVLLKNWDEERPNIVGEMVTDSVMRDFDNMDKDADGMIDEQDLTNLSKTVLTKQFRKRVIEVFADSSTHKMNFEQFIRFRIAWDSLGDPWANTIFFDVIDADGDSMITSFEFNYFYEDLLKEYREKFPDKYAPPLESIMSERFDMCAAESSGMSKEIFVKARAAANFVWGLVDLRSFCKAELGIDISISY